MRFMMTAAVLIGLNPLSVRGDYAPYRYQPTGENRVVLMPGGGNSCGCGSRGGRLEYAPYRYQATHTSSETAPGIAGSVQRGEQPVYRFIDLQPRYQYGR